MSDEQREKYTPTTEEVETHWADVGFAGDRESFRRWLAREHAAAITDAVDWARQCSGQSADDAADYIEEMFAIRAAGTETRETG